MPVQDETAQRLRQQLQAFANEGIDHIVLGCTHYPFFKSFLLDEIAQQQLSIKVVDSGQAIAERVKQLLDDNRLLTAVIDQTSMQHLSAVDKTNVDIRQPLTFHATKYSDRLGALIERLLGKEVVLQHSPE